MQIIDTISAAQLIQASAPDWAWLLRHIESEDGYVRFPPLVSRWIKNLNVSNYPQLYEDERRIGAMALLAFLTVDEMKELESDLQACSEEERGALILECVAGIDGAMKAVDLPKTSAAQIRAKAQFDALSEGEKIQAVVFWQRFLMGILGGFYQSLSIMVHGQKLTTLVAQAKTGNDEAFAKAVQIDKRILYEVPYFKDRFASANMEGDRDFLELVAAHMSRPPYKGKIRHKALYLAFALLEQLGVLDQMKHDDLLDLCNQAGLDAHANRIDDVKNLSKRLADYRRFQRLGLDLSTP